MEVQPSDTYVRTAERASCGRREHRSPLLVPSPFLRISPVTPQFCVLCFVYVPGLLDSRGNGLHLSDEAKLNLYETIGFLIGMPGVPIDKQVSVDCPFPPLTD